VSPLLFSQLILNQVEDAQAHEAQAQRITKSMARALGQEYNKRWLFLFLL